MLQKEFNLRKYRMLWSLALFGFFGQYTLGKTPEFFRKLIAAPGIRRSHIQLFQADW